MPYTPDFYTGFEMGEIPITPGKIPNEGGEVTVLQVNTGTYAMRTGGNFWVYPETPRDEFYVHVYVRPTADARWGASVYFYNIDQNRICSIRHDVANTHWDVYVDDVKKADGAINHPTEEWHHLQIHVVISDTGLVHTRIDNVDDIAWNGDTLHHARTQVEAIGLGSRDYTYWDDFGYGAGDWPGFKWIDPFIPNADTATKNWSRSAGGDNYALVDEVPSTDADYIYATSDVADLYDFPDWDGTDKGPNAVKFWVRYKKLDAGSDDKIRVNISDGANTSNGVWRSILTSWNYMDWMFLTNPSAGGWTETDIDGLIAGPEVNII